MQKDLITEQLSHTSDAERRFGGLERLYGAQSGVALQHAHVAVVGIGGVGSWAAEALARSGVGALTLIDLDHVAESNINRQVHALTETLGQSKIAAMAQTNMKRLLAYSSIAHTGYVLMAVASIGAALALPAIGFYLVAYLAMTSLAFIVLLIVTETSGGDEIYCFQGLHERSPLLAAAMTVAMISLAGLPLSAGFFGKFFIFQVTFQQGHYGLLGVGTISVVAGIYYYLKVIKVMYWKQPSQGSAPITLSKLTTILISLLIAVSWGRWYMKRSMPPQSK
jgi:NADH-quinone oxidoreductase subunit N